MLPRHILEKTTVFRKKGVEIWAFDGTVKRLDQRTPHPLGQRPGETNMESEYSTKELAWPLKISPCEAFAGKIPA